MDSNYGRGGVTSNEDVLRNFCTNTSEVKANNLSTHYDSNSDELLLRQYGVLIAKRKGDKLMITSKRYSVTTSKVQNELLRIAMEYGLDVQKTNEFAKGGQVTFGSLYNRIVDAVKKDINVSKEEAVQIVNNHETLIVDMIEFSEITNPKEIADIITTSDNGEYAKGGEIDYYENLAVYVQGKGQIFQGTSMKQAIEKARMYLKKNPNFEVVIVDEKYGDVYDTDRNYINEYAKGGKVGMIHLISDNATPQREINIIEDDILRESNRFFNWKNVSVQRIKSLGSTDYDKFIEFLYKKGYGKDKYAKGGEVEHQKLSASLKSKLKSANNILKRYGGREITEDEATMWNVYHNATSGFEAGYEAFDVAGAKNYHNATTREHHAIGDNLIDISRKMTGVHYDDYNFRGTKEENENYYLMNYKNKKYAEGGDIAQGNYEMMLSQAKEVEHHVEELQNILKGEKDIDAWVVAKMENVSSTLSDITHYLDGKTEYAHGGEMHGEKKSYEKLFKEIVDSLEEDHQVDREKAYKFVYKLDRWDKNKELLEEYNPQEVANMYVDEIEDEDNEYARGGETKGVEWVVNFTNEFDRGDYVTKYVIAKSESEAVDKGYMEISDDGEESDDYQLSSVYKLSSVKMAKGGMVGGYSVVLEAGDIKNSSFLNYLKRNGIKHEILSVQYGTGQVKFIGSKEALTKMIDKFWSDMEESEMQEMYDSIQKNEYAKGGNINSKTNKKMATKKVKDGQSAPQTKRWIFAFNKGGYNYYNEEERPYKKPVDAEKKGAPVGYRFSKFAEEKGITNNRFRKPTKSEVEQYAGKKKNGKLIMYRETRSNKSDVNPKKRI